MFGSIGGPELLLIFVVALLIFGPRKLPELGKSLGKGLAEFRRAANDLRDSLETEVAREGTAPQASSLPAAALPAAGSAPPGTLESTGTSAAASDSASALAPAAVPAAVDAREPEEPQPTH
ncbi:MAG TPA: twin-arginine translocase TatA/TatE family subunit [Candidatus Polarisedimenticolia bacterium]|nr:twin-arginine translocase TatA/TatE family subunit [Candidatus Polarisedimenticolia bacterium]